VTAAVAIALAPGAALAAPVDLTDLRLEPSCTHPGGVVVVHDTLKTTTTRDQTLYVQVEVRYFGASIATQHYGPFTTPPYTTIMTATPTPVPWYAPIGDYTVNFGIGPSAGDRTSWGTRSAGLAIRPWQLC
jgi:hypothetical protein